MSEHQKFPMKSWGNEFQSLKLNVKVNKPLIKELITSINCGSNQLCRIIGDSGNGYLSKGKETSNANYAKIRATADFLGVPPWLIFTGEGNEKINQLYEDVTTSPLDTFIVSSLGEDLQKVKIDLSRTKLTPANRKECNALLEGIKDILEKSGEYAKSTWGEILKFLHEEFKKSTLNWGCHLALNNNSYVATLRITKWEEVLNDNKTRSWSSAWICCKLNNNLPYPDELQEILNDITTLIGKHYWEFPIDINSLESSAANLYSWHSNRVDVNDRKQYHKIGDNLPLAPRFKVSPFQKFGMIQDIIIKSESCLNVNDNIDDLINWIEKDDRVTVDSDITYKISTLKLLLNRNLLKENDKLIYKYYNDYTDMNKKKAYCSLVIQNGKPRVKWAYDDNIYSISSLTKQMLLECGRISPSTNPNGNRYWFLEGRYSHDSSLYDIAINLNKDENSDQFKLF